VTLKPCVDSQIQKCVVLANSDSLFLVFGEFALWAAAAYLAYRIFWRDNLDGLAIVRIVRQREWRTHTWQCLVFGVGFRIVVWFAYLRPAASR
jgi:hypothetical protein